MSGLYEIDAAFTGLPLVGALAALGFLVGILTGLFGVGGAFVITPLLNVIFKIPYELAVGSSLCFSIGTSATGVTRHLKHANVEIRSMIIMAVGALAGSTMGVKTHQWLLDGLQNEGSDNFTLAMNILFIGFLLPTSYLVYRGSSRTKGKKALLQKIGLPPYIDIHLAGLEKVSVPGMFLAGFLIGFLSGLMGVGGGVFLVPILMLVVGLCAHLAVGTSLGVVLFSSMLGTIGHWRLGHVDFWIAGSLFAGSIIGVPIGTWICHKLHAKQLSRYFSILILAVVITLIWKSLGLLVK